METINMNINKPLYMHIIIWQDGLKYSIETDIQIPQTDVPKLIELLKSSKTAILNNPLRDFSESKIKANKNLKAIREIRLSRGGERRDKTIETFINQLKKNELTTISEIISVDWAALYDNRLINIRSIVFTGSYY